MGRCRPAAAAYDPDPQSDHSLMIGDHFVRRTGKDCTVADKLRQSGISLRDQWQTGHPAHTTKYIVNPINTQATIRSDDVGAGSSQCDGSRFWRGSQNRAAIIIKSQHGNDRNCGGDLPYCDNCGTALFDVKECFKTYQVSPGRNKRLGLFMKCRLHLIKRHLTQRLDKLAGRPDRSADIRFGTGFHAGNLNRPGIDLGQAIFQPIMGQFEPGSAKGVGDDYIGARLDIVAMNRSDNFRHGQVELLR